MTQHAFYTSGKFPVLWRLSLPCRESEQDNLSAWQEGFDKNSHSTTSSGQGYLCLPVLGEISHGMHQNGHRNMEYLHFWLWPPMTTLLGTAGKVFLDLVWIHRTTPGVKFLQVHFRGIHKLQYVRSFLKKHLAVLQWIIAHTLTLLTTNCPR